MGFVLSPEVLTVLGNAVGRSGYRAVFFLVPAALAHLITTLAYGRARTWYPDSHGEIRLIRDAFGNLPALCVPLCARMTVTVCYSTALLATAGYMFNEVFVYWFPNLGFSFCLLAVLLLVNLSGMRVCAWAQVVLVGTTVVGLILLILTGLFDLAHSPIPAQDVPSPWAHADSVGAACLLVFVGFDLAVYEKKNDAYAVKAMMIAIIVAGLIFVAWGWVSAKYVPLEKLVDTSIPHVRTARALLGSAGRIWMGIIVLAGVSAAVNALFMAVPRMTAALAEENLLPSFLAMGQKRKIVGVLMVGAAVAAMMASGMAGEPILETFMKAGIFFWFLHYAVTIGAAIQVHRQTLVETTIGHHVRGGVALLFVGFLVMVVGMGGVFMLAEDRLILFYKIAMIFAIALILGVLCVFLKKHGKEVKP